MAALRSFLGAAAHAPAAEQQWAVEKLEEQARRLRALDVRIDAQRASRTQPHRFRRRSTDRAVQ